MFIWNLFVWNGIILFLTESFMELMISSLLCFEDLVLSDLGLIEYYRALNFQGKLSFLLAVGMVIAELYMPWKATKFIKEKAKEILYLERNDRAAFKQHEGKYSSMHEGLNLRKPIAHN